MKWLLWENIDDYHLTACQVGGLLDNKGYGIATQRGTPYKNLLDKAILTMLESGFLHKARVRWWKQRRGGGACEGKVCM